MKTVSNIIFNDEKYDTFLYEPPKIEVVEISVEKGFADSTQDWGEETW
jgi:hypothetical protein